MFHTLWGGFVDESCRANMPKAEACLYGELGMWLLVYTCKLLANNSSGLPKVSKCGKCKAICLISHRGRGILKAMSPLGIVFERKSDLSPIAILLIPLPLFFVLKTMFWIFPYPRAKIPCYPPIFPKMSLWSALSLTRQGSQWDVHSLCACRAGGWGKVIRLIFL